MIIRLSLCNQPVSVSLYGTTRR